MNAQRKSTRAVLAATAAAASAAAWALDPLEFVAGWTIDVPESAAVFDVPLPPEVYAGIDGLEQLAVLDANGAPQAFFRVSAPQQTAEQRVVLEASPLYADGSSGAARIGVTSDERRTSVTVTPGAAGGPTVTGFVLDARAIGFAPAALELDWRALPQPFLLDVGIEQSDDLTSWRRVGSGSVAALALGGAEVRHARVPVRARTGGYYRVTARGTVADWHLLGATLVGAAADPAPTDSVTVAALEARAAPEDAPAGALYFDAGALPVQSVALAFDGGDGWLRADVAAARSLDGPWRTLAYGELFYSLSFEGQQLASRPLSVGRQELRYWRIVPHAPPRGRIALALTVPEERLRVALTGEAPYLLAAGTLAEEAGPDATLASVWANSSLPAAVPLAALGERRELGGAAALVPEREFPWRTAALWAALLAGVLVALAMAVRLAREMSRQPS